MNADHWSNKELLEHLYGIAPEDAHLQECGECRARRDSYARKRSQMLAETPEIPEEFMRSQRRAILERIRRPARRFRMELLPSAAALLLLLSLITVFRAVQRIEPLVSNVESTKNIEAQSDAELYQDIYKLASSTEPLAFQPMSNLFEVQP